MPQFKAQLIFSDAGRFIRAVELPLARAMLYM
jgi:hypothetical protein